ncbi:hypothetical protein NUH88_15845 [Nisaea acidiphila]|uniref:Uncharacterized protein n=1 Tax=Nisaea acidiphila TaxID=1862145 RepID=A0A9J7AR98_9PROT|nr:hypothetical protein [Nisaea acidiphila]UUX48868.1 hypothetical protein NUH88_15845 [Nisaea acidiphila]
MSMYDQHEDDENAIAGSYGASPTVIGVLIGLALIAFMFALADGFA